MRHDFASMGKRLETKLGQNSGAAWSRADNNSGIETQKLLATGILRSSFTSQGKLCGKMGLRLAQSCSRWIGSQAGGLAVSRGNPCHRSRESVASSLWLDLFGHRPNATPTMRLALPVDHHPVFLFTTMKADPTKAYNQDYVTGFIRLNALRLKIAAKLQRKKKKTLMILRIVTLVSLLFLDACNRRITWTHVIPKNYQGFLVIRYDCPNGYSLKQEGASISVIYSTNGALCVTNGFLTPWVGSVTCRETDGTPIPFVGLPWGYSGRLPAKGLCGGDEVNMTVLGKDFHLDIMWVGDPKSFAAIRNTPEYQKELDDFLNK